MRAPLLLSSSRCRTLCAALAGLAVASGALLRAADQPTAATTPVADQPGPTARVEPENPAALLQIDDDVRHFFASRFKTRRPNSERLREIVDAILEPDGLNFTYETKTTLSAQETFRQRRGNCVSFSFLVVAVAREFGFIASFQEIDVPPMWNRFGTIVATLQHVNVHVDANDGAYTVDLRRDAIPHVESDDIHAISDEREFAHYYNNVAVFRLAAGDTQGALRYMDKAVDTDPGFAAAWINRGWIHARTGDLKTARAEFERALKLDREALAAMVGLVDTLRRLGTPDDLRAADKLDRRAQRFRDRNPYYHQYLGVHAQERNDWVTAENEFRRAIELRNDEPEFYGQWIGTLKQLGRDDDAGRATRRLEKLQARIAAASAHITR